jgi:uncharacterized protein (TIGR03437 family)
MIRSVLAAIIFWLPLATAASLPSARHQQLTPSPAGPFHVSANQILDSKGRVFLMRGTQLKEFHLQTVGYDNRSGEVFGAHSSTSLSAIRLRFNMNTVRLPLDGSEAASPAYFMELAKVVRRANGIDLLVILASKNAEAAFWSACAAKFKDTPNVLFDAASTDAVKAIRAAGAMQPVLLPVNAVTDDSNIIYEASPSFMAMRSGAFRDAQFGALSAKAPVTINGWDLELDKAACSQLPSDPSAAAAMIQADLDYFDAHQISWTVSTFEPGKLVQDLSFHDATTLENGWTCGVSDSRAGMGRVIEGHLRASEERGLFVVSGSGGPDVARGAISLAYGPIMADFDAARVTRRAPLSLGHVSVQVTDALGVTRPAGMLWASAGWGQANFVIPEASAPGPAVMTLVREDGTQAASNITIGDTAPGFLTGQSCRGPAIGSASEIFPDGHTVSTKQISTCVGIHCRTLPVPMREGAVTRVKLIASGYRYAASAADIEITIAGVRVPVLSYGPTEDPGFDFVTVEIPQQLRGMGEVDLMSRLYGRPSNAVLISLGGEKPASVASVQ